MAFKVGNGSAIRFLEDVWADMVPIMMVLQMPRIYVDIDLEPNSRDGCVICQPIL